MRSTVTMLLLGLIMMGKPTLFLHASEQNDRTAPIACPKELPEAMPKEFARLLEIVNTLHTHVSSGNLSAIKDTILEHNLVPPGKTWQIRLGFSSLADSEINHFAIAVSPQDDDTKGLSFGFGKRGVNEIMHTNMLWEGSCLVAVRDGKVTLYRERATKRENASARKWLYFKGLQVRWSTAGKIQSQKLLETPKPWTIKLERDQPDSQ